MARVPLRSPLPNKDLLLVEVADSFSVSLSLSLSFIFLSTTKEKKNLK
jgi:hypothetical protein